MRTRFKYERGFDQLSCVKTLDLVKVQFDPSAQLLQEGQHNQPETKPNLKI